MTLIEGPEPRYACCQHCGPAGDRSAVDHHGWPCARCGDQKPIQPPRDTFSLAGWPTLLDRADASELWTALSDFIHSTKDA